MNTGSAVYGGGGNTCCVCGECNTVDKGYTKILIELKLNFYPAPSRFSLEYSDTMVYKIKNFLTDPYSNQLVILEDNRIISFSKENMEYMVVNFRK